MFYFFYKGDKHNIIEFMPNGTMIIDGSVLTISDTSTNDTDEYSSEVYGSGTRFDYSETPFYGQKASDYKNFVKTIKKENIGNGSFIQDWAIPTIASAIAGSLFGTGAGIAAGFLGYLATEIRNNAANYAPKTAYFSYSVDVYETDNSKSIDRYYLYDGIYCLNKKFSYNAEGNYSYKIYENKWIY